MEEYIAHISRLLKKSMAGTITPEEREELWQWRRESVRNEEIYMKLEEEAWSEKDFKRYRYALESPDWNEFKRNVGLSRSRRALYRNFLRYAAVFLLIAGAAALYYRVDREKKTTLSQQVVSPDTLRRNKAILEIAGNTQIVLGEVTEQDKTLFDKYGIEQLQTSLAYTADQSVPVEQQKLTVPRGGEYRLTLSDGTKVWINSESVLSFPNMFLEKERLVAVEGEAYFEVAENPDRPFIVETGGIKITVTGTEFNVMSYPERANIETTLVRGAVTISDGRSSVDLRPDMQAVYNKSEGMLIAREVDVSGYIVWKQGLFEFNNQSLEEIAVQLARWYDVEFVFEEENLKKRCFTGAVKKTYSLEFMLDRIRDSFSEVDYRVEGKKVFIRKK